MNELEMKARTKAFALRVMKLVDALPRTTKGRKLGDQLMRSGTSVGANYRAACRSRSKAEFVSKLGIAEEEADETGYWLELIVDGQLIKSSLILPLLQESNELLAIIAASRMTARRNLRTS
jgi:four helix bundle protein